MPSPLSTLLVSIALAPLVAAAAESSPTSEGSQIREIVPLVRSDRSVEAGVLAAVIDGESCLWRTDGTASGTFRIDVDGGCVPLHNALPFVHVAGGIAYFIAGHRPGRYWRTDGTSAGTWPLMGFLDDGLWNRRFNLITSPERGLVLFLAGEGITEPVLWVSDGSRESAQRLDVPQGLAEVVGFSRHRLDFQLVGSEIFFFAWRGGSSYSLWKTDGTSAGTTFVDAPSSSGFPAGPRSGYPVAGRLLFFLGGRDWCIVELWASDGTGEGTEPVRAFTGTSCPIVGLFQAARVDGFPDDLFFAADDGVEGGELWRSDGTAAGSVALTSFAPPQPFADDFPIDSPPVGFAGGVFFVADDGAHGRELWRSDGTPGGTRLMIDLCPGACSSSPASLAVVGGLLAFSAEEPTAGRELWVTDGTAGGTRRVGDLCPGPCGTSFTHNAVLGGSLLFVADDAAHGSELWSIALPAGTPVRLTDLPTAQPFETSANLLPLSGRAVFTADDGERGRELWVTDGTPSGTHLLADLETSEEPPPTAAPEAPINLVVEPLGGGNARFAWEDRSDDETSFLIEALEPGSTDWRPLVTLGPDVVDYEAFVGIGRFRLRVRAGKRHVRSEPSNEVALTFGGFCEPTETELCLGGNRFRVLVNWRDQHAPPGVTSTGQGRAIPAAAGGGDSGYFWFFTPDNLELAVKVLDGRSVNGHFWTFWGALSDVEYTIHVEDTFGDEWRRYHNPPGNLCGGSDIAAFSRTGGAGGLARTAAAPPAAPFAVASGPSTRFLALDAPARAAAPAHQPCVADEDTLCLLGGELAVSVDWTDQHNGGSGGGRAIPYTDLTGFFWFFHPENVELVVKALDGRTVNGRIWVFYGALTDVGYTLRVEHLASETHAVRTYENPPGVICGRGDTAAF